MPRGQKFCPKCGHGTGPRAFTCPQCKYSYKEDIKQNVIARATLTIERGSGKRGIKRCPKCDTPNGVRTYFCKNCQYNFDIKRGGAANQSRLVQDWQDLPIGQFIRVLVGSGPYYQKPHVMERISMGHDGIFKVIGVQTDGLEAKKIIKNQNGGFHFIYMGPTVKSPQVPYLIREAHKIIKVKPKTRVFV